MPTAGTTLAQNPFQRAAWGRVLGQTRPHVAPWARQVRFCAAFHKDFCETHPSSMRRAGSRTSTSPDTVHRRLAAGVSSNSIDWGSCACAARKDGNARLSKAMQQEHSRERWRSVNTVFCLPTIVGICHGFVETPLSLRHDGLLRLASPAAGTSHCKQDPTMPACNVQHLPSTLWYVYCTQFT